MVKNSVIALKHSTTDALETASKRAIQETAEATGDLIGNTIADKITNVSKETAKELLNNDETKEENAEIATYLQKKESKLLKN